MKNEMPAKNSLKFILALWHITKYSQFKMSELFKIFGNYQSLFAESRTLLKKGLNEELILNLQHPPWDKVEQELAWLNENSRHHIITWDDDRYPSLLREIIHFPAILFATGNIEILNSPQLAMVGSRNPSVTGLENAQSFAYELSAAGFTIISGLAAGIDAGCHKGALEANGKTIAVMGTGIDRIYPAENKNLAQEIIENDGVLITEFPLGTSARRENFPQRNRIISGMSLGTLVMEAAQNSGSLITARFAVEQGREVFAIPGSIHNPLARGCHALLRQGAKLIDSTDDILEELRPQIKAALKPIPKPQYNNSLSDANKNYLEIKQQKLLHCIGDETTPIDMVIIRSKFTAGEVSSLLTILELKGLIKSVAGGYVRCKEKIY